MMEGTKTSLLCLLLFCIRFSSAGFFTIIGPRSVQLGHNYRATLVYRSYFSDQTLTVTLWGDSGSEDQLDFKIKAGVDGTKEIFFDLSEYSTTSQNYSLSASIEQLSFEQSVAIVTIPKKYSIFIQTDRSVYKPDDKVNFRVLVLDRNTKPFAYDELDVTIINPNGEDISLDAVNEDDSVQFAPKYEFDILDCPKYGNWSIKVRVGDDEEDVRSVAKKFEVTEYVLPRYEVFVNVLPDVIFSQRIITARVYARYNFGKYVKGRANVTARVYDPRQPQVIHRQFAKSIDVQVINSVSFNMISELGITNTIRNYDVILEAEFTENLTGNKKSGKATTTVHKTNDFKLVLKRPKLRIKPGFPYTIDVFVKNYDGTNLQSSPYPVIVNILYHFTHQDCVSVPQTFESLADTTEQYLSRGTTRLVLDVPFNTTKMDVTVKFSTMERTLNITRHVSRSNDYIVATVKTASPTIGQQVEIEVGANVAMTHLYCVVLGRSDEVFSKTYKVTNKKTYKFKFLAADWMMPKANVIVYFIQSSGEIIYDRIKLKFVNQLPNKLDLGLSASKVKPGVSAAISMKSSPNSFVGLTAVDKSVLLQKTGHDIDENRVFDDLMAYNAYENLDELEVFGGNDRYLDFGESNAFIMTNAIEGFPTLCLDARTSRTDKPAAISPYVAIPDPVGNPTPQDLDDDEDDRRVRRDFRETWIFDNYEMDDTGYGAMRSIVPDTITSWVITGFTIDPLNGLGIARPTELTVFQPFFIVLNLPYSIRYGEILKIPVSVFNYLQLGKAGPIQIDVTLLNLSDEFEFIDAIAGTETCQVTASSRSSDTKGLSLEFDGVGVVEFVIRPLVTGKILLNIKATSGENTDEVEQSLLVESEGLTTYRNYPMLLRLPDANGNRIFNHNFRIFVPEDVIEKYTLIEASVIGDLLGKSISSVDQIFIYYGSCIEQTTSALMPYIIKLNYLSSIGQNIESYRITYQGYVNSGLQRWQIYQYANGAFPLYPGYGGSHSLFVTAYISKCLGMIKKFYTIDDGLLLKALRYVASQQQSDGSFYETGRVQLQSIQRDLTQRVPLTAYIVIAYLENHQHILEFKPTIDRAITYLSDNLITIDDNLALAMVAYAFTLYREAPEETHGILAALEANSYAHGDLKSWSFMMNGPDDQADSTKVEIAAYALLAYLNDGKIMEAVPIANWMITRINPNGGYRMTQDTVMGLQALAMMSTAIHNQNILNMDVSLRYRSQEIEYETKFHVDQSNAMTWQSEKIPSDVRLFQLEAKGDGVVFFQLAHQYNTLRADEVAEAFNIAVRELSTKPTVLHLEICTSYIPQGYYSSTGMANMEIKLPSGYVYDSEESGNLLKRWEIRKTDVRNGGTTVILYMDGLNGTQICPQIKANRIYEVAILQQGSVRIFDFYTPSDQGYDYFLPRYVARCSF